MVWCRGGVWSRGGSGLGVSDRGGVSDPGGAWSGNLPPPVNRILDTRL